MRQLSFIEPGIVRWEEAPDPRIATPDDALVRPLVVTTCDALATEMTPHHSITAPSWKIGRYIEITRPPITTPRKRMTAGSSNDMRFATVLSTSSS